MASFSFGAGNAAKLIRLPLYLLGRVATLFIPRTRGRWAFGSAVGIADGALALWEQLPPTATAVWLVGSDDEARVAAGRGIPTARRYSLRGFWHTARADVVVLTHGFGDVNRYATGGAFVVQLWHGIPLKRIGLDSPETARPPERWGRLPGTWMLRWVIAQAYRFQSRRIDLVPAASHLVRGRLESAFALPDGRVPVTGEPRVDVLSRGEPAQRRALALAQITAAVGDVGAYRRIVLYAPTWRDGQADPAVPTRGEWERIDSTLARHDALLLVRSHPLGDGRYEPVGDHVRLLGTDLVPDVTVTLSAVDVLITDYSSLIFDVGLVPAAFVPLAPDQQEYTARRGLYGTYADVAPGPVATSWDEALVHLEELLGDDVALARAQERSHRLSARVHDHTDAGNSRRVYRAILARREKRGRR